MTLTEIHNTYGIRLRYFGGYDQRNNIIWNNRKSITPHQLAKLFSIEKVNWWVDKAENQDKPFSAIKKECFKVTFHKRRSSRIPVR